MGETREKKRQQQEEESGPLSRCADDERKRARVDGNSPEFLKPIDSNQCIPRWAASQLHCE